MNPIRMGIVGLGGVSRMHLGGIQRTSEVKLVAVCDSNLELLHRVADEYGVPASHRFEQYEDMFGSGLLDAVVICTPNVLHYPIAKAALTAGIPCCLEKPVAMNAEQAKELAELADEKQLPTMVSFTYRYKASARFARRLIQEGHLGQIYHVYAQYFQGWGIGDATMSWRFSKALSGSGALGDLGCHMFDLSRFLVGDITKVMASADTIVKQRVNPSTGASERVDVDDYCHVLASFEGGVSGTFAITRFAYARGNYQRVEVYGSNGALVYGLDDEDTLEVCIGPVYGPSRVFTRLPAPSDCKQDLVEGFVHLLRGQPDGLSATLHDGYRNQRVVDAVIQSFTQEAWVRL